jgi:hypothetical protein
MSKIDPGATGTVEVAASPATVYALITDLDALAELAEETAAMRWTTGTSAAPGAKFRGTNRNGWHRWTTTCEVTDALAGQRFAFDVTHTVVPIARWQYDIVASGPGCTVTETMWDRRPGWFKRVAGVATGVRDRAGANTAHIELTLQRLKVRAEAGS